MILGVTGCPGSGKSVLAATIARHGWHLLDADEIGREVVEGYPAIIPALVAAFGDDVVTADGALDRRLVAARAFATPEATAMLNGIVHPVLIGLLVERIGQLRERGEHTVVDCALIYEWGIEREFDVTVCVRADRERRIERIVCRDGRSPGDIERIAAAQLPEEEKARRADIAFANDSSLERLEAFARLLAMLPAAF